MQTRLSKDLIAYLPGKALPALAAFVTVPIYTHLFSPDQFGMFVLAAAIADLLMLATTSGFCSSAVRFFSAYQAKSNLSGYFTTIYGGTLVISLTVAALSAGLLLVLRPLISPDFVPLLWAAIVLFVLTAWFDTLMHSLRGQEKSGWYSFLATIQAFGAIIFGLIFVVVFQIGIGGLIWGQSLAFLLTIFPLVWLTTRGVRFGAQHLESSDFQQLWRFAWPVTAGNIAFWVLRCADRYIVQLFRGSFEVGLYAVPYKLSSRSVEMLVSLFLLVPGPIIYRIWEERGRQATEETLTSFTRMYLLVIIPAAFGLGAIASPLVRLLADEAYYAGYRAVWLVACASVGLGLSELACFGSMVAQRTRPIARNWGLAAGASLVLNLIFVPLFGFMGAAFSAAVSFLLLAGLQARTSARYLTWRWPLKSLWRISLATAVMCAAVLLVQTFVRVDTTFWQAVNLALSVLSGSLVYGSVLWLLGEIRPRGLLSLFAPAKGRSEPVPLAGETGRE